MDIIIILSATFDYNNKYGYWQLIRNVYPTKYNSLSVRQVAGFTLDHRLKHLIQAVVNNCRIEGLPLVNGN